jgi:3-oxoacyl-[acyl-carrier-protein] synthase-1
MSANRDGVNIGEGAVAFLMTADASAVHLLGAGESSDAHHISAPDPSGAGALVAMRAALEQAATAPDAVAYVNLHGTATALNDAMEAKSVAALLGADVPCSSTKGMTGHLLGAAGALEAAFLWLSLEPRYAAGRLPPHLWDGVRDPEIAPIRLVAPGESAPFRERAVMLSNSFAFGGNNCSLVLGRRTFG